MQPEKTHDESYREGDGAEPESPPQLHKTAGAPPPFQPQMGGSGWLAHMILTFKVNKTIRQRMAISCQTILPAGEEITYAIYCQRRSPYFLGISFRSRQPRVVVITRAHVWLIRVGMTWAGVAYGIVPFMTPPKGVLAQLPRETRIGPLRGWLWGRTPIGGERVWIPRKFFSDVEAADKELTPHIYSDISTA
jgi:hypothetical protein